MGSVRTLTGVLGLALVSGVNLYATVLTIGLAIRYGWITGVPPELQWLAHPVVLILAGVMYLAEFIADKVPFFTPIWDAVHTFIRPLGGALLAAGVVGNLHPMAQIAAALVGGTVALGAHPVKMGTRLLAHAAPEPASHSVISLLEDFGVMGMLILIYTHPWISLAVLIVLIGLVIWVTPKIYRTLRRVLSATAGRIRGFLSRQSPPPCE